MKAKEKVIYLTFDDGPIPEITEYVLDILQEYNAKATFFCVGDNVVKHPPIFSRIITDGHSVGNHSYSHLSGWKTEDKKYVDDVMKGSEHIKSNLFRPPYGKITRSQAKHLGDKYKIVMWDVLSGDFDPKMSAEDCFNNIIKSAKSGSIIVLHDNEKTQDKIREFLPLVLQYFSSKNYKFLPIQPSKNNKLKIA